MDVESEAAGGSGESNEPTRGVGSTGRRFEDWDLRRLLQRQAPLVFDVQGGPSTIRREQANDGMEGAVTHNSCSCGTTENGPAACGRLILKQGGYLVT